MKLTKRIMLGIVLCLLLMFSACGKEEQTETKSDDTAKTKIRIGTNLALGTVSPYVAIKNGYFNDTDIECELVEFSDGSALMEAFAAGELDLAFVGITPVATWQLKGADVKVIAAANGGGHVLLTRKDTGIQTVADLKGKKIAEPSIGTVTDTLFRAKMLVDGELTQNDITAVPGMKPADMATVLEVTQEVDAILTWEPYASQAELTYSDLQVLYDASSVIKDQSGKESFYPVNVVVASGDMLKNHADTVQTFMDVYKKTVDFINQDATANSVIANVLSLDEAVISNARKRIDFNYNLDEDGCLETLQWAKDLGYIEKIPDKESLFDLSFQTEAKE